MPDINNKGKDTDQAEETTSKEEVEEELTEEEKMKRKIEELRRRDPFIYR